MIPSASLKINVNGFDLMSFPNSTVQLIDTQSQCASVCISGVVINLQMNDYRLQTINTITCKAEAYINSFKLVESFSTNVQVLATSSN